MNPSDDFVMEEKALKLLASLHELTSLNIDSQSQTTCNFCIRKVHSVINDTIPFEVACALLEDVEKIVTILQTTSNKNTGYGSPYPPLSGKYRKNKLEVPFMNNTTQTNNLTTAKLFDVTALATYIRTHPTSGVNEIPLSST